MVEIKIRGLGSIKLKLSWDEAPQTCANFVALARSGFYDGLTFHRIIKGFMIQGGDPVGNGTGGPGYSIKGEFFANGFHNYLHHAPGVISMARAQHPDSAGSQFFICDADDGFLDGQYAAFGHVAEEGYQDSMKTLRAAASVKTGDNDLPRTPVVIEKVIVSEDEPAGTFQKLN